MDENSRKFRCCFFGFHVKYATILIGMIEIIYISVEIPFNMFLIAPKLSAPDIIVLIIGIILHVTIPIGVFASIILMLVGVSVQKSSLILAHFVAVF